MEVDQEHKNHLCKLCNQSFGIGKSLGDHTRVHGSNHSSKMGFQFSDQNGYPLRHNPKKSWRFSDCNNGGSRTEYQCKVCGKDFLTIRAIRSERDKIYCKDCNKGFGSIKSIYAKQSEDEFGSGFSSAKRPRTKRYKVSSNSLVTDSCTFDSDDEEAAMILLLLSKGVRTWGEFDSMTARFLGGEDKGLNENGGSSNHGGDALLGEELTQFGDLDSGFSSNKENGGDSDDVVVLLGEKLTQSGHLYSVILNTDEKAMELEGSIDGFFNGSNTLENGVLEEQVNCTPNHIELFDAEKYCKKVEYKCRSCFKVFRSPQALGGHRARPCVPKNVPENTAGDSSLGCEVTETLQCKNMPVPVYDHDEAEPFVIRCEVNKSKAHVCAICMKCYASGRALGGHMRAHYKHSDDHGFVDVDTLDNIVLSSH